MSDLHSKKSISKMSAEEIKNVLSEYTPLYSDINNLIAGYAERYIFNEGDVIYNRDGVEGLNIKYIIQKKTKNYLKVYKCIGWWSIPLNDIIDFSLVGCECSVDCKTKGFLLHYKSSDHEETGDIRRLSFNRKKYFIYKYKDHLVCNELDMKPVRRSLRFDQVNDEYIPTTSKYRPIHPSTHILKEVVEIVNNAGITTNLKNNL
jgi:hypothetical protein